MTKELEAYKAWAPPESPWSLWTKPVLFAPHRPNMAPPPKAAPVPGQPGPGQPPAPPAAESSPALESPEIDWLRPSGRRTLVIIDLPGKSGVEEGLRAAVSGYRPIPLYNGVRHETHAPAAVEVEEIVTALFEGAKELRHLGLSPQAPAAVEVEEIVTALFEGAKELRHLGLSPQAPPAFLLDADRMTPKAMGQGTFDNRWRVFPQDMPSAALFLSQGFDEVLVRASRLRTDLSHILYRYQLAGMKIKLSDGQSLKDITVPKPSQFGSLMYRFKACMGLKLHAGGGFGGLIPAAGEGGARGIG